MLRSTGAPSVHPCPREPRLELDRARLVLDGAVPVALRRAGGSPVRPRRGEAGGELDRARLVRDLALPVALESSRGSPVHPCQCEPGVDLDRPRLVRDLAIEVAHAPPGDPSVHPRHAEPGVELDRSLRVRDVSLPVTLRSPGGAPDRPRARELAVALDGACRERHGANVVAPVERRLALADERTRRLSRALRRRPPGARSDERGGDAGRGKQHGPDREAHPEPGRGAGALSFAPPGESPGERPRVDEAFPRVGRESPRDDGREPTGDSPGERRRPPLELVDVTQEPLRQERPPAREALVEDDPEREHVGLGPHVARSLDLLEGHVTGGPDDRARRRDRHAPARAEHVSAEVLREAEVGDEGLALPREEDVLRLEVAVDDPALVGAPEGLGEPPHERDGLVRGKRPPEAVAERPSLEQGHDEPATPSVLARVEHRHEPVRLREAPEEAPLAFERGDRLAVRRHHDLDRDGTPFGGAAPVDDAHAAPADLGEELVLPGAPGHAT